MRHNRIFAQGDYRLKALKAELTDVTCTAAQWDFPFAMRVERDLLRSYTLSHVLDDEGYYLVGEIILKIDAVLHGRQPCGLVSYGKHFGFNILFVAQHRKRETAETMELWILIGPCDGKRQVVYVIRVDPPF